MKPAQVSAEEGATEGTPRERYCDQVGIKVAESVFAQRQRKYRNVEVHLTRQDLAAIVSATCRLVLDAHDRVRP